ncbi:PRC-barrel domain-containing protein [Fredinandcohnia sp. QZ13]|uniref:PRC-barrel domain-containing protein n=1 Tax=Fredinandcohnia sp. QZ13 TaxID=3073144 RepID=UPI0028530E65|nr:PRC-barrel domain-containing protein [Fredinandcohnia sp. QZ13]MDR4889109.1 PRC-barrel domain-containing protein [Fredinandcohnia sp. QZ13]
MKKSVEIVGLPIISIIDGIEVGKVKSLVINPEKGSVDFLTIEHEDWQVSVKAIPFKRVVGIGEYAVTIESESSVIDLNEIPIANSLVNKKIKITNTKVMTRKGQLLGEVLEYYVDDETGNLLGTLLNVSGKEVVLASEFVLTYGKDIIIVGEDASSKFLDSVESLENPQIESTEHQHDVDIEELLPESTETQSPFDEINASIDQHEESEAKALRLKQVDLLYGKVVTKDILDSEGNVIIPAGTHLSVDDIIKAQEEGPSVFVELSMNVEE